MRSASKVLNSLSVKVIGVSRDSVAAQRAFSDKFSLNFPLLSDEEGRVCDAFHVLHPRGRPSRETFLFRGTTLYDHDRAPNPGQQAAQVLRVIAVAP